VESGHNGLVFVDFCLIFGSGDSGESSVSAERIKMVLVIMDLRWNTSVEAVEFPIRQWVRVKSLRCPDPDNQLLLDRGEIPC
jgi:hypothetical protein